MNEKVGEEVIAKGEAGWERGMSIRQTTNLSGVVWSDSVLLGKAISQREDW